jgi:hypothetical protein
MLPSTFIVRLCGIEIHFTPQNTNSVAFLEHKERTYDGNNIFMCTFCKEANMTTNIQQYTGRPTA